MVSPLNSSELGAAAGMLYQTAVGQPLPSVGYGAEGSGHTSATTAAAAARTSSDTAHPPST